MLSSEPSLSPRRFDFQPAHYPPEALDWRTYAKAPWNMADEDAHAAAARMATGWVCKSDTYQVHIDDVLGEDGTLYTHLSIKRIDRHVIHDWRELQGIKNAVCGPEREAVEIYPAESRLVDTANQFHLWVLPEGRHLPFGWDTRLVTTDQPAGVRQRPFAGSAP